MDLAWDQIAEAFSKAYRRGENPTIEDFLRGQDDPQGELRELLESIAMIEGLKEAEPLAEPKRRTDGVGSIDQLDDYQIVGEIGRGGMGVVFEAIHQSLGRRVAIKVIAESSLGDQRMLQRFRQEAQAAAQLTHSNIVPVYGVGQCDNYHYYVMDLVDGTTVRSWLRDGDARIDAVAETIAASVADSDTDFETKSIGSDKTVSDPPARISQSPLPTARDGTAYYRCVAKKIADVCDALDYAHRQGTLHRDIKPSNLLLDRQGTIWITDFGLAKLDQPSEFTKTGDIVGTPQYMPPESFDGSYDVRSEVYAVGLTLFELLTGRPAIPATSQAEAIRLALRGVTTTPRRENDAVPKDLETITMKALAMEPSRRYFSMRALRDDLSRYLNHQPISAKRTRSLDRLVRWCRREPLAASLTAAVFVSITALAIVSAVGFFHTRSLLRRSQDLYRKKEVALIERGNALRAEREEQARAKKNLAVAIAGFDQIMANIQQRGTDLQTESFGDVGETISPDVSAADAELLQSLLGFYDELADNNSSDFRLQSASALHRVGDIYQRLGRLKDADEAYNKALRRYREIETEEVDDNVLLACVEILNEQANIAGLRAQVGRAGQIYNQTINVLTANDHLVENEAAQFEYARANVLHASTISRAGIEIGLPSGRPDVFRRFFERNTVSNQKRLNTHFRAIEEAINVFDTLYERNPDDMVYRVSSAKAYREKARIAMRRRQRSVATESIERAIDLFEEMLQANPDSESLKYEYVKTLSCTEAITTVPIFRLGKAMRMTNQLLESHPEMARYRELKAGVLRQLSAVSARRNDLETAIENRRLEIQLRRELIQDYPDRTAYKTSQWQAIEVLSDLYRRDGQKELARQTLDDAIRLVESVARENYNAAQAHSVVRRLREKRREQN